MRDQELEVHTQVHKGSWSGSQRLRGGEWNKINLPDSHGAMGSTFFRVMRAPNQKLKSQTWTVAVSTVPQAGLMALSAPRN